MNLHITLKYFSVGFVIFFLFALIVPLYGEEHDIICEIAPLPPPVRERIENRTFPSIALPEHSLVHNIDTTKPITRWDDGKIYYNVAAKHDMYIYVGTLGTRWYLTPAEPAEGVSTQLFGNLENIIFRYQQYAQRNPNMLFFPEIRLLNRLGLDELPADSEFWLRDTNGNIITSTVSSEGVAWDEWTLDILNPKLQELLIERVVAVAECGIFQGVLFDAFVPAHQYAYDKHFGIDGEVVIEAYINILKGIRARVRDDFLILVNRNRRKSERYAEWINGALMEIDLDYPGGYTYQGLIEIEDALLWNEKNLREPKINVLMVYGVEEPLKSLNNLRWMRLFTTMSLTHSDGYFIFRVPQINMGKVHIWYDFWDADLGRPVGGNETKGQPYNGIEGLFIREFTNGWAAYNRSGQPQKIQFPGQGTGVASGITSTTHIVPDLDGEMYLKQEPDTVVDVTVKVLDIELTIEDPSEWMPDAALLRVVREALEELGLPAEAPLTKEKMLQLTSLKANHRGIVDITGLEFALSLKDLEGFS